LRNGSAAARLGLEPGDMLVSLNKRPIDSVAQLEQLLSSAPPPWVLTVKRGDKLLTTPPLRG
jgi:serine protease Do